MIFSILVTGALRESQGSFASRFLVDTPCEEAAVSAVERELDWSEAAHFKATSEGAGLAHHLAEPLTAGIPRWAQPA